MKSSYRPATIAGVLAITAFLSVVTHSSANPWTDVTAPFPGSGPDTSLLLTDGTVLMHDWCTTNWYRLTPDINGLYETGTWSAIAAMPSGYAPAYFASEILPDGNLIVNGGEYNNPGTGCALANTNQGALYNPVTNSWTTVSAPAGWTTIGNSQSAVLPNLEYVIADCCNTNEALTANDGVSWSVTGTGKADPNTNEGWTNLPNGDLLTVDTSQTVAGPAAVELYSAGSWSSGGTTFSQLVDPTSHLIGPGVLRPDGYLVYFGATGNTNLANANLATPTWAAGPSFPVISAQQYAVEPGPAALLPHGNILVQASPGGAPPSRFFLFTTTNALQQEARPASAHFVSSGEGRLLVLPTGQALWSNDGATGHAEIATYTPTGSPLTAWRPVITSVPTLLIRGSTANTISGQQFNGWSQGASYGSFAQESTNYPIVRIVNNATGHVFYARSYHFTTMGVWTAGMNARFDVPATCELGASRIYVVVNGIVSHGMNVTVKT